jgi:hypothetical protein
LAVGEHLLHWRHRGTIDTVDAENGSFTASITVRPGMVDHVSLKLKATTLSELRSFRNPGWQRFAGTALMPDGNTPSTGLRLLQFATNSYQPVSGAWADANGKFVTDPMSIFGQGGDDSGRDDPDTPVLLAWVPGATAKQVVSLPTNGSPVNDLRIKLSRGHRIHGQVTIAGKSPLPFPATITLRLQHQGGGKLSSYLSEEVSVDADGRFDLPAVTPGRYLCQACLDKLWLSNVLELNASGDHDEVRLDILPPGGPARLRFLDSDGLPIQQGQIDVDWPDGPLTLRLHSEPLRTDGDGWLTLDGCARGTARVRVHNESKWHEILIPDLSLDAASPQNVTID